MLPINSTAPDFTLQDQNGTPHTLSQYKGKKVLLYFYPKDDTPGCTTEACTIRDSFNDFEKMGIVVLGVSKDAVESHKKFEKKFSLPFPLLSDPDKSVIKQYGAINQTGWFKGGTKRISYLIDESGKIAQVYEKVKPETHAQEVLGN